MRKLFLFLVTVLSTVIVFAQAGSKADVILKTNGEELTGKVTSIEDEDIKFTYQGETLVYTVKKKDVVKITFGSGRIEFYNKQPVAESSAPSGNAGGDPHNKVAVLPFSYIKNSQAASDEMALKAQNDTYSFLRKSTLGLTFIDPRTTNALLAKAGISRADLQKYTMDEICNILGVEFVVDGSITQNLANTTSSSSTSYSDNSKRKDDGDRKNSGSGYSSSTTSTNYETSVAIAVYNNKNSNIFNENRRALLNQNEGIYDSPLTYLLKRCPLYKK